jgi:phospholipid/cholesterol/gamma-HCH transport system substrate-binding protein
MFHLTIVTAPQRRGYQPGEEPRWADSSAPNCYGMPASYYSAQHHAPGVHFADGTSGSSSGAGSALPSMFLGNSGVGIPSADSGLAGTDQEQQLVAALLSTDGTVHPSAITTLLAGPILRGSVVSQQ